MLRILQPLLQEDDGLDIGGTELDFADPTDNQADLGENELESPDPVTEKPVQSSEENSKYAAARREAEQKVKALEAKALQDAIDLGYESVEDMDRAIIEYRNKRVQEEKEERIEQFGYDPEEMINKAVEDKLKSDPRFIEIEQAQNNKKINDAIETLNKEFGLGIKTSSELDLIDNADKITKLVGAGFDLVEAYKMANYESLNQTKAVKDARKASESGRAELGGINGNPNPETVSVPKDVGESLRRQGWDDDKILSYYKMLKNNTR